MWFEKRRQPRLRRLQAIETLEGRAVPTTFIATNAAQFAADIAAVNNTPGPNTILLTEGDYYLGAPLQIVNAGNLTIRSRLNNAADVRILANHPGRVMEIDGGSVDLSAVTLSGGNSVAQGAGVLAVNAQVSLTNSTINGNTATSSGGGVYVQGGTLNVVKSAVGGNSAGGGTFGQGGGIAASNAQVTITTSTVNNNTAAAVQIDPNSPVVPTAQGGAIYTVGGTLDITGSKVSGDSVSAFSSGPNATGIGGAIATSGTTVAINQTTFLKNSISSFSVGGALVQGSVLSALGSSVTITGSTFTQNAPTGWTEFNQANSTIVIRHSILDGRSLPGTYTLGNNSLTQTG